MLGFRAKSWAISKFPSTKLFGLELHNRFGSEKKKSNHRILSLVHCHTSPFTDFLLYYISFGTQLLKMFLSCLFFSSLIPPVSVSKTNYSQLEKVNSRRWKFSIESSEKFRQFFDKNWIDFFLSSCRSQQFVRFLALLAIETTSFFMFVLLSE